ncbi:MAG: hypothetical protein ACRDRS_25040 [Pseudonocardiaceae bacterium]
MLDRDGSQILIIGPAVWRFSDQWNRGQPVLAVEMAGGGVADNTVYIRWSDLVGAPACMVTANHSVAVALTSSLFRQLEPSGSIEDLVGAHWAGLSAAPLFLLGRSDSKIVAHTLVRLGEHDGLFIRIGALTHPDGAVDVASIMPSVLRGLCETLIFANQGTFFEIWRHAA